jgi:hypothetical protein
MSTPQVITLLKVASNDLPTLEYKYVTLKNELKSLEERKRNLYNQITEEGSNLEYYRVQSNLERAKFYSHLERRKKAEASAIQFENNNLEYVRIRKAVEEKIHAILSDGKAFIQLALFCIIESIKRNPYKYSPLISENVPPSESHYSSEYFIYSYDRPTYFDVKAMLEEEAANLYKVLSKDLAHEILHDYDVGKPQPSLPLIAPSDVNYSDSINQSNS